MKYRADIDGLRTLAVVPVVLNHANIPGFTGGFIGVDVFFVISGFLITGIIAGEIEHGRFSLAKFYERRARRILPALFTVLAACSIAGWFFLTPTAFVDYANSQKATLFFISNIEFWKTSSDYFGSGVELAPLLHTWSLAVEEQFYLFFPLLLIAIAKLGPRWWKMVVSTIALLSFVASVWMTSRFPVANFYLSPFRAWELGAGALLALGIGQSWNRPIFAEVLSWLGIILIAASIAFMDDATPFPGLSALPSVLGASLIIFANSRSTTQVSKLLSWRPVVWMGLISYSLYLWHWPVLVYARIITEAHELPALVSTGCVILSVLLAWISWRFIEQPFRKRQSGKSKSTARVFAATGAGILCLASLSGFIHEKDGMLGQFSEDRLAIYTKAKQRPSLDLYCTSLDVDDEPCRFGAEAAPVTALIFGDSHASAMLNGFDTYFASQNTSAVAFVKSACPPLLGVYRVDRGQTHQCDKHNAAVVSKMREFPDLDTVYLAARWALATEGSRATNEMGRPAVLAKTGSYNTAIQNNAAIAKEGLEATVSEIRNLGLNVVILAGVPEMPFDVAEAILRKPISSNTLPSAQSVAARNHRADLMLESVSNEYDARIVRPMDFLCDTVCIAEHEGFLLYRDDDHLSAYGSNWLLPKLID